MNSKPAWSWSRLALGLGAFIAIVLLAPVLVNIVHAIFIPLVVLIVLGIVARLVWFFTAL